MVIIGSLMDIRARIYCTRSVLRMATVAHRGGEGPKVLVQPDLARRESQVGTKLVDRQPESERGETDFNISPGSSDSLGCSQDRRLGCRVQGSPNGG